MIQKQAQKKNPAYIPGNYVKDFNQLTLKDVEQIQLDMMRFIAKGQNPSFDVFDKAADQIERTKILEQEAIREVIHNIDKNISTIRYHLDRAGFFDKTSMEITEEIEEAYRTWSTETNTYIKNFKKIEEKDYENVNEVKTIIERQLSKGEEAIFNFTKTYFPEDAILSDVSYKKIGEEFFLNIPIPKGKKLLNTAHWYNKMSTSFGCKIEFIQDEKSGIATFRFKKAAGKNISEDLEDYINNFVAEVTNNTAVELKNLFKNDEEIIRWEPLDPDNGELYNSQLVAAFRSNTNVKELVKGKYGKYFQEALQYVANEDINIKGDNALLGGYGEWYWQAFFFYLDDVVFKDPNWKDNVIPVGVKLKSSGEVPIDLIYKGVTIQSKNYKGGTLDADSHGGTRSEQTLKKLINMYGDFKIDKKTGKASYSDYIRKMFAAGKKESEFIEMLNRITNSSDDVLKGKSQSVATTRLDTFLSSYGLGNLGFGDSCLTVVGNFLASKYINREDVASNDQYKQLYSRFEPIYDTFKDVFIPAHAYSMLSMDRYLDISLGTSSQIKKEEIVNQFGMNFYEGLPDLFATKEGIFRTDELLIPLVYALQELLKNGIKASKNIITNLRQNGPQVTKIEINITPFENIREHWNLKGEKPPIHYDIPFLLEASYINYTVRINFNNFKQIA